MPLGPKFPLPNGYFGDMVLSNEQDDEYRAMVQECVDEALQEEDDFALLYRHQVDMHIWRQVKQKHGFHVYRRKKIAVGRRLNSQRSHMLGFGRVDGSLEDILYGWYNKSHEETKVTLSTLSASALDATVLHNIDNGTPEHPFHYIGLKWMLTKVPVLRPRDWSYIEAIGISQDDYGRRFGYFVQKSVALTNCPTFRSSGIIRSTGRFVFILRERRNDDRAVDVFSCGSFGAPGDVFEQLSTVTTAKMMCGVFEAAKCGEAKKLTVLAAQNANCTFLLSPQADYCFICQRNGTLFSPLRRCGICTLPVCQTCRVKNWTFLGDKHAALKVDCCLVCMEKASDMRVHPSEPDFAIPPKVHNIAESVLDCRGRKQTADTECSDEDRELRDKTYWRSSRRNCMSMDRRDPEDLTSSQTHGLRTSRASSDHSGGIQLDKTYFRHSKRSLSVDTIDDDEIRQILGESHVIRHADRTAKSGEDLISSRSRRFTTQ